MYNHMSTLIEGLETETTDKFDEVKEKLFKELKKIEKDNLSIQEQGEKTQEIFDKLFSNWSEDDIQTFQTGRALHDAHMRGHGTGPAHHKDHCGKARRGNKGLV